MWTLRWNIQSCHKWYTGILFDKSYTGSKKPSTIPALIQTKRQVIYFQTLSLSVCLFLLYLSYLLSMVSLCLLPYFVLSTKEVYLFEMVSTWKASDWKTDGYRWENNGTSNLPRTKPVGSKTYSYIKIDGVISKTFLKEVFTLYVSPGNVVGWMIM